MPENDVSGLRSPHRVGRVLGLVAAVALVSCALALPAVAVKDVLWPRTDRGDQADALVVLSGDHGERLARAEELLARGAAPTLVLAGEPDLPADVRLCAGGQKFEVICLRPQPDDTRAEARATAELAARRRWHTVVVVTSRPHVARARLLFSRCFTGRTEVVGAPLPFGGMLAVRARFHEVAGLLYAWTWARGC